MNTWQIFIASLAAVLILTTPVACTMNRQQLVEKAISKGADPIAAKCAIEADTSNSAMCIVKAAQNNPTK